VDFRPTEVGLGFLLEEEHIEYRWATGEEFVELEALGFVPQPNLRGMLADLVAEVTELGFVPQPNLHRS
jgi:hypothetical protein